MSITSNPAFSTHFKILCSIVFEQVIMLPSISKRTPIIPLGSRIPSSPSIDGLDGIRDPRGMIGVRLEMEGSIITCSKTMLHNILKCVEKAGLDVMDICLQTLGTGEVALSSDEKNLGVALLDIGGGSTSISIFEDDELLGTSVIPLGGNNVTKDLSIGLKTTSDEAEDVK